LTTKQVDLVKFLLLLRKDVPDDLTIFHLSEVLSVLYQNSFTIPNNKVYLLFFETFGKKDRIINNNSSTIITNNNNNK